MHWQADPAASVCRGSDSTIELNLQLDSEQVTKSRKIAHDFDRKTQTRIGESH